jgi:hypothetical protein
MKARVKKVLSKQGKRLLMANDAKLRHIRAQE